MDGFFTNLRPQPSAPVVFFYSNPLGAATPRTADECVREMLRQLVQLTPACPTALKLAHESGRESLMAGNALRYWTA